MSLWKESHLSIDKNRCHGNNRLTVSKNLKYFQLCRISYNNCSHFIVKFEVFCIVTFLLMRVYALNLMIKTTNRNYICLPGRDARFLKQKLVVYFIIVILIIGVQFQRSIIAPTYIGYSVLFVDVISVEEGPSLIIYIYIYVVRSTVLS